MIIAATTNIADIKAVLCEPSIYDTISSDGAPLFTEFEPPITSDYVYVGGYIDSKIIGLMVYHKYLDGLECHVQVLPEYRAEHAKRFGEKSLTFRGNLPLYAEIPDLYKNVLSFALLNDFKVIKVRENDYIKNGETYNVNVLKYKGD
jgi:hypothetical protein